MRQLLTIPFLLTVWLTPARAQRVFSYDQPDRHAIPLPASIRALLDHDKFVVETLSNQAPVLTGLPEDWVLCYRVSLGRTHETDYLIQANHQLAGANVTRFWVFRMIGNQPKQVLFTGGLSLEINLRRSNGLREIRTYSVTMQRLNTEIYRFNGTQYIHTGGISSSTGAQPEHEIVPYTTAMRLTLKPEVEALLQQELSSGRFQDTNDALETALHVLADTRPYDLTDLDAKIQEGIDSADRGELYTEEEARAFIAALQAKL
jgi:predicted transcriptional regulator